MRSNTYWTGTDFLFNPPILGVSRSAFHLHGAGGNALSYLASFRGMPDELCRGNVRSFCASYGATSFGNQAACDILTARKGTYAPSGKVILVGGSMGGMLACNWARQNPNLVALLVLIIPLVDGEDFRSINALGYQASFEAAYGGNAAWQAARPNFNPVQYAAQLSNIPTHLYYSTDDPVCRPATTKAFADAHGRCELFSLGAQGHGAFGMDNRTAAGRALVYA